MIGPRSPGGGGARSPPRKSCSTRVVNGGAALPPAALLDPAESLDAASASSPPPAAAAHVPLRSSPRQAPPEPPPPQPPPRGPAPALARLDLQGASLGPSAFAALLAVARRAARTPCSPALRTGDAPGNHSSSIACRRCRKRRGLFCRRREGCLEELDLGLCSVEREVTAAEVEALSRAIRGSRTLRRAGGGGSGAREEGSSSAGVWGEQSPHLPSPPPPHLCRPGGVHTSGILGPISL